METIANSLKNEDDDESRRRMTTINVEAVYDVDPKCGSLIIDHYPLIPVWPIM